MGELEGRRALVTGGGRGIGREVARDLAGAGAAVAVAARTRSDVDAVAAEIAARGGRASALTADVTRPESVREMFAAAREALGGVDILVSAAGIAPTGLITRTSDALWRDVLETNLSGVFYCLREALPEMSGRGWGRIVHVASIAGKTGYPYIGAYAASKHGVLGLTKVAALEAAASGVTVNAVCPGYVDTPMLQDGIRRIVEKTGLAAEEARRRLEDTSPQKRLYTVEEVSALVLFLCGETARGVNGQALNVDGGTVV
jgi:NAD(P)-dependent dehydrogenase (short-subunit alcohol dehydrogenase family)